MLFELVEAQLGGRASIIEEAIWNIPFTSSSNTFQGLGQVQGLLVPLSPPQASVVVITARLIALIRPHLWFTEILFMYQHQRYKGPWQYENFTSIAQSNSLLCKGSTGACVGFRTWKPLVIGVLAEP